MEKVYNPKEVEPRIINLWKDSNIFAFDRNSSKPIFSIDTPPPYASADHLHAGHGMHFSQFEFIARFKRMSGFNVLFPMGFDDNGLPTERYVEKKYNIDKTKITRSDFIKLCLKDAEEVGKTYRQMWTQIGLSVDWSLLYTTINPFCQKIAQKSFIELYNKKLLERVEDPIMWCVNCQTAIAQADLEDLEKNSTFVDVKFKFKEDGSDIVIATTRPELIPACVALFVHPNDERYKSYVGKKAIIPIFNYEVPIIADESVSIDVGTGFMMVCTWGDVEDVEKWKKYGLDTRLVIDEKGIMNDLAGKYKGMSIKQVRKAIVEDMESQGLVVSKKDIVHVTNVHERCGTPIEIFKTPQWFIKVLDKKKELLDQVNKIKWHPEHMKVRAEQWINNLGWNWCISRQRFYGIPFPVWYCKKCKSVILADEKDLPVNPMDQKPSAKCKCGHDEFEPEKDVMDTWMTSSMTPQIVLKWGEKDSMMDRAFPMSLRPQGHDIIRTWAFYTIVKSFYHENSVPWNDIMISGHGLDPHGKKMSKSKGNVAIVEDVVAKYSADALRFWAASAKLGSDLPYQEKDVLTGQKTVNKLWNASLFCSGFIGKVDKPELNMMDRWLMSKIMNLVKKSTEGFDTYQYSDSKQETENFFWHTFCDNYLEIVKHRAYANDASAKWTLREALITQLKLFSPIIPFVTEEIYQNLFKNDEKDISIHISQWPCVDQSLVDKEAEEMGDMAVAIISTVRQFKSKKGLALNTPVKLLTIECDEKTKSVVEKLSEDIKGTMKAENIEFGSADTAVEGYEIKVNVLLADKPPKI
jgi:valyl-tRNA synthetase